MRSYQFLKSFIQNNQIQNVTTVANDKQMRHCSIPNVLLIYQLSPAIKRKKLYHKWVFVGLTMTVNKQASVLFVFLTQFCSFQ